jgi:RNA polymerase sigma factor for flagellar operon FliA
MSTCLARTVSAPFLVQVPGVVSEEARRRLVEDHLDLVQQVASRWRPRCRTTLAYADLCQVGALALVEASRRYDPSRCDSFAAFAHGRVRGAICDALRQIDPLSRRRRAAVRTLEGVMAESGAGGAGLPRPDEIAQRLGWSVPQVEEARADRAALSSGWAQTLEVADAPANDDPCRSLLQSEAAATVRVALADLSERQRMVLSLYYREELTLREIGEVIGVTESRVSQIRSAAIAALRASMAIRARAGERRMVTRPAAAASARAWCA